MVRTMIKKADYKPYTEIAPNVIKLMYGREDMTEDVLEQNDSGELTPTGEKRETDYCTVMMEMLYYRPSAEFVAGMMKSIGLVDMEDARQILPNFNGEALPVLKDVLLHNIETYDKSDNVQQFTLNGEKAWLSKDVRVGLMNSINIESNEGQETTTIWINGKSFTMQIDDAIAMLKKLEIYAIKCFRNTARHRAEVNEITSIDELVSYDYKSGYPEVLNFEISV